VGRLGVLSSVKGGREGLGVGFERSAECDVGGKERLHVMRFFNATVID
jgi:hypothetical protein